MTTKAKIIALHRENPNWNANQIAAEIDCDRGTVRNVGRECGLRIPTCQLGRPRTKPSKTRHCNIASGFLSLGT